MSYSSPKVYWATWTFIIVYTLLAAVYFSVFIQNNSPIYTWFASLGAPGSALVSYRNTFAAVSVRLTVISHGLSVAIILLMIYTRENRAASITSFVVYIILLIFTFIGVVGMGSEYSECNESYGNLCNSLMYCCVNVGVPGCNNPLPCPGIIPSDLQPNIEFLGLFWVNFVLFLLQLGFVIAVIVIATNGRNSEPVDELPPPPPPPPQKEEEVVPSATPLISEPYRTHGLKKRIK
jgi:hypothetical protein